MCNPVVYPLLHDDDAPPVEEWEPVDHPLVSYVAVYNNEKFIGIVIVNAHSRYEWETHSALLPNIGWRKRVEAAKEFFDWLRAAGCRRVLGKVVTTNRYAMKFNETIGMIQFGIDERSFMRDGYLQDQAYFGLSL